MQIEFNIYDMETLLCLTILKKKQKKTSKTDKKQTATFAFKNIICALKFHRKHNENILKGSFTQN